VWDDLGLNQARRVAKQIIAPFLREEVDEIRLLYNEFKSAMTQVAVDDTLFPLSAEPLHSDLELAGQSQGDAGKSSEGNDSGGREYIFEPDRKTLLDVLVPMYIEVTLLRALYESMASELGARMTAMDSATKNASDMIDALTLQYNRARQAAITTELMEIIGGAEALSA
jgi:F-type H+-transporting ATPase subunit gamma